MRIKFVSQKGVILVTVLSVILVVVVLAAVIISIMSSHSRLTHHQVSRIQAQYAAMAASNYAFEMMRQNITGWDSGSHTFCSSGCNVTETTFPRSIRSVTVTIGPGTTGPSNTTQISAVVDYTYNP